MKFKEYQEKALATSIFPKEVSLVYPALGLCGEVGEVAEKIKKIYRDEKGLVSEEKRASLLLELGDVLWYMAVLANDLNLSLDDVAEANIEKLKSRLKRGVIGGEGDDR
jgi:NTP pyrophosphatase (non-canonical NTP hydrolase)